MERGLSQQEVKVKYSVVGKNRIPTSSKNTAWDIFLSQFPTVINCILFIAGLFSLIIKDFLDGIFILAIIIINACFGFIQEYRAQQSLEKLKDFTAPTARVIREGKESEILAENLVPDDIVVLAEGSRVPADGTLFEVTHLEIDESLLTGESLAIIKTNDESAFLGTLVTKGKGFLKITATGQATRFGQIADSLATMQTEKTPLQITMDKLGTTLSYAALLAGLLIIPIGYFYHQQLIPLILVSVSIGIAAIPEGLPAVVTIAFAVGTHRMAKRGAIVRKMSAVETLGAIQLIVVDKTGTITQNRMQVKTHWVKEKVHQDLLAEACILGNTASLIEKGSGKTYEILGDQTDGALLVWAKEQGESPVPVDDEHILDEYVFDSETKTITTVWKKGERKYVFVRGAPETILAKSTASQHEKEAITKRIEELASDGLRVIGFGLKTVHHTAAISREKLEQDLTFLGLMGLYDPPRKEVKEAVHRAHQAGIQPVMVTGDNELTALSLAKDIGIISAEQAVITGEELEKMSDADLTSVIAKTRVFARTKPEQKLRLVALLKQLGYVVGVTGDGVNDALALKKADVGVAMGEGGTDVAKEAADIVLTDNNFATIIKAIEEGRVIYKNISNALIYLLSGNLAEISLVFFATLFQLPFPLLPTQILWINLVTDSLPALALATGSRDATVLFKKPRNPREPFLNLRRSLIICGIGFALSGFLLILYTFLLRSNTQAQARTIIFNLLIYFHLLIVMVIGRHSLRKGNLFLMFTILLILVMQLTITYTPFFQQLFHLEL